MSDKDNSKKTVAWQSKLKRISAGAAAVGATGLGAFAASTPPKQHNIHVNSSPSITIPCNSPKSPREALRDWTQSAQSGASAWAELKKRSEQTKQSAKIETLLTNTPKTSQNKGIEAARQKVSANQSGNSSQSTNQGIKSFQSKVSGQSSGASKSSANRGQSKGSGQGR